MTHFAIIFILATVACSGAFGRSRLQMTPQEKVSDAFFQFELFKLEYSRSYSSPLEALERFQIFNQALDRIAMFNLFEKGTAEYGVNNFTDWSDEEFDEMTTLEPQNLASVEALPEFRLSNLGNMRIPSEFDWRSHNAVTPVKNQGRCGSCWAFSTVSQIENYYAIKHGAQKTFSEQQLVDCDKESSGCNGGWMASAIQSIIDKGGLNDAASYPYEDRQGSCRHRPANNAATVSEGKKLRSNDESGMAEFIATKSSTINAINSRMLQYYKSGIINTSNYRCSRSRNAVDHAVNVIGYGRDSSKGLNFWIGKNSWGPSWGEKGFFRIARGSNTCGIANYIYAADVN